MTYGQMQKNAHRQVAKAIQENTLVRPHRCEVCGIEDSCDHVEIVAHHWKGYDYPLDIWWICKSCNWQLRGKAFHIGGYSRAMAALMIQAKSQYFGKCYQCAMDFEYRRLVNLYTPYVEETKQCIQKMKDEQSRHGDLINALCIFLDTYDISFGDFMNCEEEAVIMAIHYECDLHLRKEFGLPDRIEPHE